MKKLLLCLAMSVSAGVGLAQQAPTSLDGQWQGWLKSAAGQIEVRLTIKGDAGEWQFYPQPMQARRNPCWTQVHAVKLSEPGAEARTLTLQGSKLGGGCEDAMATAQIEGDALSLGFPSGAQALLKKR